MVFLRPSRQMSGNTSIRLRSLPSRYFSIRVQTHHATLYSIDTDSVVRQPRKKQALSCGTKLSAVVFLWIAKNFWFYLISFILKERNAMEMWPNRREPGDGNTVQMLIQMGREILYCTSSAHICCCLYIFFNFSGVIKRWKTGLAATARERSGTAPDRRVLKVWSRQRLRCS
jgi:hypothetical protein